jgi:preprotein translocase subunit SecG
MVTAVVVVVVVVVVAVLLGVVMVKTYQSREAGVEAGRIKLVVGLEGNRAPIGGKRPIPVGGGG